MCIAFFTYLKKGEEKIVYRKIKSKAKNYNNGFSVVAYIIHTDTSLPEHGFGSSRNGALYDYRFVEST